MQNKTYIQAIDPDVLKFFEGYSRPGNARKLVNVIERTIILDTEEKIR
jgi:transcriptional regulator with PAS, ATPase and Fis domain